MAVSFSKAVKYASKLRLALDGPSGAGKTWTSLVIANGLADGGRVAVIDTEKGSASKYADIIEGFEFDVLELDNFHPNNYIEAIHAAEAAGYAVLVIDSLSHAWNGQGGLLEIVESITKRLKSGSSFQAWSEATPLQNRLIDAITRSRLHIICTMRTKTEYVIEPNAYGKSAPRKVGTAPIQRADIEYEFDVYGNMSMDNELVIQKSRCPELSGQVIPKPNDRVAEVLKAWLSGEPAPPVRLTVPTVYEHCMMAGVVASKPEFYAYATALLNSPVSQQNVMQLSQTQLQLLMDHAVERNHATA